MPRLLVAISAHGFGHLAQTAPVLNALRRRMPELELVLRTTLPRDRLADRIAGPFELMAHQDDFGMVQRSALEVDRAASLERYVRFHHNFAERVSAVAAELAAVRVDRVLADVPYLTLAAAAEAGIPAVAMCSLNWAAIYTHYAGGPDRITDEIVAAYERADCFLRPVPSMPMPELQNVTEIGPVGEVAPADRTRLTDVLGLAPGERVALVALGGIPHRVPIEDWPVGGRWRWLVPAAWQVEHPNALAQEQTGMSFRELLASCDALITKPGYGSFVEAAAAGRPVLFAGRPDWPEAPFLEQWLATVANCRQVSAEQLDAGALQPLLDDLMARAPKPGVLLSGVEQAAALLAGMRW